jgi:hypothetical protein
MKRVVRIIGICLCIGGLVDVAMSAEPEGTRAYFENGMEWPDNNGRHINAHGGGVLYQNSTYYWYGSHRVAKKTVEIDGQPVHVTDSLDGVDPWGAVHCFSSKDLYNWTDEGVVLHYSGDAASPFVLGCKLERAKVIYNRKTGKYVMWFHHELKGQAYAAALVGVATADNATGSFRYVRSFRINAGRKPINMTPDLEEDLNNPLDPDFTRIGFEASSRWQYWADTPKFGRDFKHGQMSRDQTVYMDDDGQAYHVTSSEGNRTIHISRLTDDYLGLTGEFYRFVPPSNCEAPAVCKYKGKYYLLMSGTSGWRSNAARYAVADNMMGPWTYIGNPCVGEGADITYDGQSTFLLPVKGKQGAFIAMFDRWNSDALQNSQYLWLPVDFDGDRMVIGYHEQWDLSVFDK